ncbi:FAD-binding oxidoreductase [Chitinimonas sp.]|uniref:FAD-binding oxidoreductase n=1 Tax=Chitinimonas sp. TaxID=1934313 RepID=UPI0035AEC57B
MDHPGLHAAILEWRHILGVDRVLGSEQAELCYGACTTGLRRRIAAALRPTETSHVASIVKIAARYRQALYPISTGNNWGYGSALPVQDGCVLLDLRDMNRILDFDEASGVVTLEPGVTQGMLSDYLHEHSLPFMVPTTGAGPDCSLLGNALERGYGITPHSDHFAAVMSLQAVLANGDIYRPVLAELGGETVDAVFKWGVGPYLDGLFAQGNAGIVTSMSIALARRPEAINAFLFSIQHDADLEQTVSAVQAILRQLTGVTGSINLMNTHRILAMTQAYPEDQVVDGLLPAAVVADLARRNKIGAWTCVGALYGHPALVHAARKVIRRLLRGNAILRLQFFSPKGAARIKALTARFMPNSALARRAATLDASLKIMAGTPSRVALPLAYWKTGQVPSNPDPARDGCGLLWYAPLVPLAPQRVRNYVNTVYRICQRYSMEPLITLTSLSERCMDSSVPLLFDRDDPEQVRRAHDCYDALFEAGQQQGFLPYRLHIGAMGKLQNSDTPSVALMRTIRRAMDPYDTIAPQRYGISAGDRNSDTYLRFTAETSHLTPPKINSPT